MQSVWDALLFEVVPLDEGQAELIGGDGAFFQGLLHVLDLQLQLALFLVLFLLALSTLASEREVAGFQGVAIGLCLRIPGNRERLGVLSEGVPAHVFPFPAVVFFARDLLSEAVQQLNPQGLVQLALLLGQGLVQRILKVVGADGRQDLVPGHLVRQLLQLDQVHQGGTLGQLVFQGLSVQFPQLQAAADGGFREAGFLNNLVQGHAQVEHHLEAVRLLQGREVGTLHVFHEHGLDLLSGGHHGDNTGHLG